MSTPTPSPIPAAGTIDHIVGCLQAGIDREHNFELLFRRYYRLVKHFFHHRGLGPEEAEDLTQETFLQVDRGLDSFRGDARFESWLLAIAANTYRQALRRRQTEKRAGQELPLLEAVPRQASVGLETWREHTAGALHRLLAREKLAMLLDTLGSMPPQMRQCMQLRLAQGLRYREIATLLDLSVDAVKVQLARGRQRLRTHLAEHFDRFDL